MELRVPAQPFADRGDPVPTRLQQMTQMLAQPLLLRIDAESDHMDFGSGTFAVAPWVVTSPSRFTIDQVVGRLTYKFNLF